MTELVNNQPFVDVAFTMTPKELWHASSSATVKRLWPLFLLTAIATPILIWLGLSNPILILLVVLDWLFIISYCFLRPAFAYSDKKTRQLLDKETRMTIDHDQIRIYADGELRSVIKLGELVSAVRARKFWHLYMTRTFNYGIPRRLFTQAQEAEFSNALSDHNVLK